ncbi:ACP S-malonyltransferase [Actinomadura sp. NBRC 104412]|uniref:ACP S-malonyltransferase n=1 Tax=Actinomadura sp. NBRC 104412 TaxID=3032203 RepID=UPI0025549B6C|nr:ACP S-malonyltransferase [Actinomadura sp. NBRC 104412]
MCRADAVGWTPLAVVFPGQGAQTVAMGAVWRGHPAWALAERAEDVLRRSLRPLLLDERRAPQGTAETQLAVFLTSMMAWKALRAEAVTPAVLAGHSLGQISALAAAGVLGFDDAVRLVERRGQVTDEVCASEPGGMVAALSRDAGLDAERAAAACEAAPGECWTANDNAPGQVVYSGTARGLDRTVERARELGARRFHRLNVAGPFHTPLMAPAAGRLTAFARSLAFAAPGRPVILNADARPAGPGTPWPDLLGEHLVRPVRWRATQELLGRYGTAALVEVGPGTTLAGLARRTVPHLHILSAGCPATAARAAAFLRRPTAPPQPNTGRTSDR